jgi:uncharacterized cupin superfamily protein
MPLIHEFTLPLDNAEPSDLGADRIVVGKTQPAASVFWRSDDGSVIAGLFRSTPGKFIANRRRRVGPQS